MSAAKKRKRKAAKKRPAPTTLSLRTADLRDPPIAGFANGCAIVDHGLVLEFVFLEGQSAENARTVARVMATIDAVIDRLWATSAGFYQSERKALQKAGIPTVPVSETSPAEPKSAVMCNLFRIARSGTEAVLDLHYISPGDVHLYQAERRRPTVVPVMRIQTTLPVIIGIFEFLEPVLEEFKARLGRK